jgi:hypothetical protein
MNAIWMVLPTAQLSPFPRKNKPAAATPVIVTHHSFARGPEIMRSKKYYGNQNRHYKKHNRNHSNYNIIDHTNLQTKNYKPLFLKFTPKLNIQTVLP